MNKMQCVIELFMDMQDVKHSHLHVEAWCLEEYTAPNHKYMYNINFIQFHTILH